MFSGIIKNTGEIAALRSSRGGKRLVVSAPLLLPEVKPGDSLAVNGVCLTVTAIKSGRTEMDVLEETLRRSNLGALRSGEVVNLEPALRLGEEIGGHLVTGHIDGQGKLAFRERRGRDWLIRVDLPEKLLPNVVEKGSIAVEGISLTVAEIHGSEIEIHIIPYTWSNTNLKQKPPGSFLNIETDILGKYVGRYLKPSSNRISPGFLEETGFS